MNKLTRHNIRFDSKLLLLSFCCVTLLSGCSNRVYKAEGEMDKIRKSPSQPIEEPPKPQKVEDFVYTTDGNRSPFIAPSALNAEDESLDDSNIQPDVTREKEDMEAFPLNSLIYRGMVTAPNGEEFGLVQRPDQSVASVKVGDHMGMDFGRIAEITPTQINLIEIVPGDRSGFIEKPQSLVSPD